jgi:hypothetical protein
MPPCGSTSCRCRQTSPSLPPKGENRDPLSGCSCKSGIFRVPQWGAMTSVMAPPTTPLPLPKAVVRADEVPGNQVLLCSPRRKRSSIASCLSVAGRLSGRCFLNSKSGLFDRLQRENVRSLARGYPSFSHKIDLPHR